MLDLSTADVAVLLKISRWTALRLVKDGKLRAYRIGGQYRVSSEDLKRYLEQNRVTVGGAR